MNEMGIKMLPGYYDPYGKRYSHATYRREAVVVDGYFVYTRFSFISLVTGTYIQFYSLSNHIFLC